MRTVARLTAALSGVAMLTVGSVLTAAADQPAAAPYECNSGFSCYFDGSGGTGDRWRAPRPNCHNLGPIGWANRISSVNNRGGGDAILYDLVNGRYVEIDLFVPGEKRNVKPEANNKADRVCINL